MAAQRRAAQPAATSTWASCCSGRCTASSAASIKFLVSRRLGAARRGAQGLPRAGLQHRRGLRAHRGGAGAQPSPSPGNKRAAGHGGQARCPGIELQIDEPGQRRHRRGAGQGPQRDGRLLRRPRGHRRGAQGRLAAHRRPRAAGRRRAAVPGRPEEGRHHRRQREERVPGRARGALRRRTRTSRSCRIVGLPDDARRREGRLPVRARTTGTGRREEVRARAGGALPRGLRRACRSTGA